MIRGREGLAEKGHFPLASVALTNPHLHQYPPCVLSETASLLLVAPVSQDLAVQMC